MKPTDVTGPVATATAHGTPPAANGCSKNAKFLPISPAHKPTISESVTSNGGRGIEEEELNGEGIDILEPSSPQHCDIFSTSPVPPAGLFLGGGVNHGGVVVSESMMSSPPGLRSSHPHSVSALALVSPRENLWVSKYIFQEIVFSKSLKSADFICNFN